MQNYDQSTVPIVEQMPQVAPGGHLPITRIDATYMPPPHVQPAGGQGPLNPLPVAIDTLTQEVATTNELLRELMTFLAAALSP